MKFPERVRQLLLLPMLVMLLALPVLADECSHQFVELRQEPTCDESGVSWSECILCGYTTGFDDIPPLGHTYGEWYVLEEPGCKRDGLQGRGCTVCGVSDTAPIPATGHDYLADVEEPTCTARGFTLYTCRDCGDQFRSDYTDPLGHRYDDGVVIRDPTLTAMGRVLYTCIGCGDTYQTTIPMLTNPFEDIDDQAYYFTPVLWAAYFGITSGIDETHFCPDLYCTRAQVATFLWRAAGKPEPVTKDSPFLDVPEGCYYEKAVLWAYETSITMGTDAAHFSPDAVCNRAQVVTFLHRYRGCPEPEISSVFPDVNPGDFFYKAVSWAAQREITVGMDGGYFCPGLECTRGQIVTFLYRDEKNP